MQLALKIISLEYLRVNALAYLYEKMLNSFKKKKQLKCVALIKCFEGCFEKIR